jgi:hypothetical protein
MLSQEDLCYGWNWDDTSIVASAVPSDVPSKISKASFDKILDSATAATAISNFDKKEKCSENRR